MLNIDAYNQFSLDTNEKTDQYIAGLTQAQKDYVQLWHLAQDKDLLIKKYNNSQIEFNEPLNSEASRAFCCGYIASLRMQNIDLKIDQYEFEQKAIAKLERLGLVRRGIECFGKYPTDGGYNYFIFNRILSDAEIESTGLSSEKVVRRSKTRTLIKHYFGYDF